LKFLGFIGPSYTLQSINVDAQRCVNWYPEINEMGKGKGDEIASLVPTPGLLKLAEVGALGPIRLVHYDGTPKNQDNPVTRIFVISANEVYKVEVIAGVWTPTLLGTIETSSGPVIAASSNVDLGNTVFVDGVNTYLYKKVNTPSLLESFGTFTSFSLPVVEKATHVKYQDGYYIYTNETNQFFVSDVLSLNIDPLSFASAEGDPDNIVSLMTNRRDIWLLGERTTELWVNTGNADFPFERASGGFIEKGCAAKYSVAKIDNMIFWIGRDASGQGIVYAGQGLNPERISTFAVEYAFSTYQNITTAVGYTYQSRGHSFYVLNFDEGTWVFDLTTRLWHERSYLNDGLMERHRSQFHTFIPEFGIHLVGDYADNRIYELSNTTYTDDLNPIRCLRRSPHISNGLKEVFHSKLQIDIQPGVGLDGITQGTDPQMMLRFSDDGGHTWSNEKWTSMGKIGRTKDRAIWRRLGRSRDRVYEVSSTDPVKRVLIGAEIEVEGGVS